MQYDHLAYIATAYGLFAVATVYFAANASARLATAARRLKAADPRKRAAT